MKKMSRDQLLVLIGACMVQSAFIGIIVNSSGVFFAQMRVELGMTMTKIAAHNTIRALTGAASGAFLSKLFFRVNKKMYLLAAISTIAVGYALLAVGATTPLWYLASGMIGLFISISMISISYVLSHWFPGNAGLVTGIASAFSGVCGAIFSPIAGALIDGLGWFKALMIFCFITLAVGYTGVFLMLPKKGEALFKSDGKGASGSAAGKRGAGSAKAKGGMSDLKSIPHFAARFAFTVLVLTGSSVMLQFIFNISVYAQTIGYSLQIAAMLSSAVMIGNITGKIIFGWISDRLSVWWAEVILTVLIFFSILGFIFCSRQLPILYVSAFIYGFGYSLSSVGLSRCCVSAYGMEGQKTMSGIHVSISNLFGAGISLAIGIVFDRFGSYDPVLWIALAASVILIVSAFSAERLIKADGRHE